jgi:hypothetical protein
MKHLKRFNESINEYDLKDYCETNLAYLMDEGLEVKIDDYEGDLSVALYLYQSNGHGRPWSEIKDQIMPFLHRFNNVYEINSLEDGSDKFIIVQVVHLNFGSKELYISYDELENLPEKTIIEKIVFFLK